LWEANPFAAAAFFALPGYNAFTMPLWEANPFAAAASL
jgi:hypothetical protein